MDAKEPLYAMAVAARLTRMHPQTLRKYERAGLLRPARVGNDRLYSQADIDRLHHIRYLVEELGLNVAGLELTLRMADRLESVGRDAPSSELRGAISDTLGYSRAPVR